MKQGLELDLEYVRRQSLAFDLWILVKTVPVVLSTHGAL
jgi:lipopolysaccharide/colanic/teichoic acid biosynthesis glycosyltransferase